MICEGKIEEYVTAKKCQKCKPGYFRTKDEQCVNCKSEKYGGPACFKCKYEINENGEETENIICDYCPEMNHALSSDGKCYYCSKMIKDCEICDFIKNSDNTEKLVCSICKPGFYLNSEGKCINYLQYLERIQNCSEYYYKINDLTFCVYLYDYYGKSYDNDYDFSADYCYNSNNNNNDYENLYHYHSFYEFNKSTKVTNFSIPEINSPFKGQCIRCKEGFYLNSDGKCAAFSLEDCTLISIVENFPEKYIQCKSICDNYKNIYVDLTYNKISDKNNGNNNENNTFVTKKFFESYLYNTNTNINDAIDENLKSLFIKNTLCIPRNGNFDNCQTVKYDENTNSFVCSQCYSDYYIIDNVLKNCLTPKIDQYDDDDDKYSYYGFNCIYENIGTSSKPIYSCTKCNDENYLLVATENNLKYCKYKGNYDEIKYCTEANIDTTYVNSLYNCTNCILNFIPYDSKFYGRKICQNIFEQVTKKKEISLAKYEGIEYVNATNGTCEKKNLFSPDGEKCYSCKNEDVGMPGCKGACSFSLERNINLKCEEDCETGYAEISEGVCETCNEINHGCYECHYEDEYPANYTKLKRKRRFVCDFCEEGYIKLNDKCLTCQDLNLYDCDECAIDPKNNSNYICTKCNKFSILKDGECEDCDGRSDFIIDNQCQYCYNFEKGGIKGCIECERNNNDELICQICLSGFILLKNNNTCLNRSENKELEKFDSCEQLSLDNNNQLYCSKCKREYSLLKDNNNEKGKCVQLPILYDYMANDFSFYFHNYYDEYY